MSWTHTRKKKKAKKNQKKSKKTKSGKKKRKKDKKEQKKKQKKNFFCKIKKNNKHNDSFYLFRAEIHIKLGVS